MHTAPKNVLLALGRYNSKTHKGVARYAGEHHWHLNTEMANFGQLPRSWHGDGIITLLAQQSELVEFVRTASVPAVDLSVIREDIPLPRVAGDHYGIGCIGAEHFLQHGFRNFAWYSTVTDAVSDLRYSGFSDSLSKLGFKAEDWSYRPRKQKAMDDWAAKIGFLKKCIASIAKPVAVLGYCDADAVNILEACDEMSLYVPEDVAILGIDNDELLCEPAWIPLSSINHDLEGLGYAGAALLDRLMKGESPPADATLIPPKGITIRRSTEVLAVNDERTRQALQHILSHPTLRLTPDEVARSCGIPRRNLEKNFQIHLNQSVSDHLAAQRLIRAKEMLIHTDLNVTDIAARSGFNTPQYFNLVFHKEFGHTPRHFRLRYKTNKSGSSK